MGLVGDIIQGVFGIVGTTVDAIQNKKSRDQQISENQKDRDFAWEQAERQMAFNSYESEEQRQFLSKEAELAYERQQEFYDTRQSPSAMVQQYKEAGLNPMSLAGGSISSSPLSLSAPSGASSASGSAPTSSGSAIPRALDLGDRMISLAKAVEEIKLMRADVRNKESQAALNEIDKIFRSGINEATIAQAWAAAGRDVAAKDKLIQDVVNSKELTVAQVNELTQKALYHQAAADERSTASAVNVENVWNRRFETKERIVNVGLIIQNIKTSAMDEKLKGQLILQSISQTALFDQTKLEVGKRVELLGEQIGLTSKQSQKLGAEIDLLVQKHGHNQVMNAFEQIVKGIEAGEKSFYRDDNLPGMIVNVIQGFLGFDFGLN